MPDYKPSNFCNKYLLRDPNCGLCFDPECGGQKRSITPDGFNPVKEWMEKCKP